MISRIKKSVILDFFLKNKRCVDRSLILKVFEHICEFEKAEFEFNDEIQKKIKSTLNFLFKKWKVILRRKTAQKKFVLLCCEQFVEFNVRLKDNKIPISMEIDSQPLEDLFTLLNIYSI